ncbi:MAG: DUF4838 domain-containing protein [Armatimonadia bacterium]
MMRYIWLCVAIAAMAPVHAAKVVLAKGGQPAATIVIPDKATDREKLAAQELQHYVKAICGVELSLKSDGKRVDGAGLYIGKTETTIPGDVPGKELNPETYAVHVRDGNVFFTGRYPTPTYFAVASFIEDSLGVRWFAPGDEWEYVPTGKPGQLTVEVRDRVTVPDTSPRVWSGHDWNQDWKTWNLRNKTVLSEVVPRRQFQNNVFKVFPPSKYGKTHPEYYPLINGQRWIPSSDSDAYWRPCESNPEVIALVADYARKWFDAHPDIDSFSVGMDDISHMCSCDNCRAWDPHPDSYEKGQFSDRHYKFVNALAREIRKTHPDRYIGTLIYNIARDLPETVDKLEDNVFGFITETSALWWEPGRKQADHDLTREWAKRCKHLSRYDYFGMGGITPRVYPHAMAEQIRFDKSLGMEGCYIEVYTFLPNTAPMIWAFAKMQWDGKQDVDRLLGEFYADMFGPAKGTMKQYFDLLERSWNTPREGRKGWVHRNLRNQALAMSADDVEAGFRLLRKASGEAATDLQQQRIETLRAALQFGSYPIKAYAMSNSLVKLDINSEATAQKALEQIEQMGRMAREREAFWAEAPKRDDLLGETVRGLGDMGYMAVGQMPLLEAGATAAAMRAFSWYMANKPEKLEEAVAKLQGMSDSSLAQGLNGWLWVTKNKPANLLQNGDFETPGTNADKPEADWQTVGAPPGWNRWSSGDKGSFRVIKGVGINGSTAAAITGTGSACYLRTVPVEVGGKYLVIAWVNGEPDAMAAGAQLGVRFQKADGSWHPRRELEPTIQPPAGTKGWQPLILAITIPPEAGRIVIMPGARAQEADSTALIDDVAVYKLP